MDKFYPLAVDNFVGQLYNKTGNSWEYHETRVYYLKSIKRTLAAECPEGLHTH